MSYLNASGVVTRMTKKTDGPSAVEEEECQVRGPPMSPIDVNLSVTIVTNASGPEEATVRIGLNVTVESFLQRFSFPGHT
jgi:hypothetical protein